MILVHICCSYRNVSFSSSSSRTMTCSLSPTENVRALQVNYLTGGTRGQQWEQKSLWPGCCEVTRWRRTVALRFMNPFRVNVNTLMLMWHHSCYLASTQGPPGEKGDQGATEIIDYNGNIQEALQVRCSCCGWLRLKTSEHKCWGELFLPVVFLSFVLMCLLSATPEARWRLLNLNQSK